jgi:hypothetical protein
MAAAVVSLIIFIRFFSVRSLARRLLMGSAGETAYLSANKVWPSACVERNT